jgi:hypothetical protein
VCGIDPGVQVESRGGGATTYWSPEMHRRHGRTAAHSDARRGDDTVCERAGKRYWEIQELTKKP